MLLGCDALLMWCAFVKKIGFSFISLMNWVVLVEVAWIWLCYLSFRVLCLLSPLGLLIYLIAIHS